MNKESSLLLDILRGYSKITYKYKDYYFKHFGVYDSLKLQEFELDCITEAKKKGIKGKDELLELAIKRGGWSKEEESSMKDLKWMIEKSKKASAKISDNNSRKAFEGSIAKQADQLVKLEAKKNQFTNHSAENLGKRKRANKEISLSLFYDKEMTRNVSEEDLFFLISEVNLRIQELTSVENLLKLAYESYFFDVYCLNYRNPNQILDTNIYKITIWQKSLLSYASILLNKLKNLDIPDDIREDAVKVYNFQPREDGAKGDKVTEGVSDLRAKMAQRGGKLTADDF
tara:strand:- start:20720 stop:21577 length:858 start_codon:yes stop_codon:yes gene_type:complete